MTARTQKLKTALISEFFYFAVHLSQVPSILQLQFIQEIILSGILFIYYHLYIAYRRLKYLNLIFWMEHA